MDVTWRAWIDDYNCDAITTIKVLKQLSVVVFIFLVRILNTSYTSEAIAMQYNAMVRMWLEDPPSFTAGSLDLKLLMLRDVQKL